MECQLAADSWESLKKTFARVPVFQVVEESLYQGRASRKKPAFQSLPANSLHRQFRLIAAFR